MFYLENIFRPVQGTSTVPIISAHFIPYYRVSGLVRQKLNNINKQ